MQNIFEKKVSDYIKKNKKFFITIILYFLYQYQFTFEIIKMFFSNFNNLPYLIKIILLILADLIYVIILIFMYKKEIKNAILDLKNNFLDRSFIAVKYWAFGCIIMFISSIIIAYLTKNNLSGNEKLVRQYLKQMPIQMIFSCCFMAPILEEATFRISLKGLIKNKWIFIITSGLLFGLLHVSPPYTLANLSYIIPYGAMGISFAYLLYKTDNIMLPIIIHFIHNTILILKQLIGG